MFEKNLKIGFLLDFYGEVLDEHTRGVMNAYYEDDLSLAEIAQDCGISRQGVRHVIKKGEEQLTFLENALGLADYHKELSVAESKLRASLELTDGLLLSPDNGREELVKLRNELAEALNIVAKKGN